MSRSPLTFRKADVTRALEAAVAAGFEVHQIQIDKAGTITIVTGKAEGDVKARAFNAWDMLLND